MSTFVTYLRLGLDHLLTWGALDHLLFLAALVLGFGAREWKRVVVVVTAFTLGHTVTLALATLDVVRLSSRVVETAIPATIVVTSLLNVWSVRTTEGSASGGQVRGARRPGRAWGRYVLALAFGLVHGLGFSGVLRALLGGEESLLVPLLAFNVGLEVAQVVVIAAFAVVTWG
nr:HupE/UreJ family protein [Gemmatimonadaceae bacterium]